MPVYFIRSGSDGPVKIGRTNNIRRRMQMLQTGSANQLVLLRAFIGGEVEEKAIHDRLSRFRVSGEWFEASDEVLNGDMGLPLFEVSEPESESGLIDFSQNSADMGNHQPRVG